MVENDDGVDEVFHILHLVGGDDDGAVFRGMLGDDLTEEGLRGDVEAVGGFVKEQIVRIQSQSRGDEAFLLLAKRQLGEFAHRVYFHLLAEFMEKVLVVVGIEHAQLLYIINRCALRDGEIFRDEVNLLEGFR